jgi:arylsulfatase A-like enzyme
LKDHVDSDCTACPHDYIPDPTEQQPRRCILPGTSFELEGVHCGEDTGLGSVWEANLRMPALARFPGKIHPKSQTMAMISTLDVMPTILSMIGKPIPTDLDGMDVSHILFGKEENEINKDRALFFWRDGFQEGPLGPPYGRFDVAAVKLGKLKAWFWTKSAHYNQDVEEYHDPPLLFDVLADPAESISLDPNEHNELIERIRALTIKHKESIDWTQPLALASDPKYLPCVDPLTGCRTDDRLINAH